MKIGDTDIHELLIYDKGDYMTADITEEDIYLDGNHRLAYRSADGNLHEFPPSAEDEAGHHIYYLSRLKRKGERQC